MSAVDAVLSECLQRNCHKSKEEIKTELNHLTNPELQEWLRINCKACVKHDKRRKTENCEYIADKFTSRLPSDQRLFSYLTTFIPTPDLGQLSTTSRAVRSRTDPNMITRRVWGTRVFDWSPERRALVRQMHIEQFDGSFAQLLPPNLTHLTFDWCFGQPLESGVLPDTLTHLVFNGDFNQPLVPGLLPEKLTHLTLGGHFDHPVMPGIFENLTHLSFGPNFNQPLSPGLFPDGLMHLSFGLSFNQPLVPFPISLTHLSFGYLFNQPLLPGIFNDNLTHLELSYDPQEDPILPDVLPHSLEELTFKNPVHQEFVTGVLPPNLVKLKFIHPFRPSAVDVLPPNLNEFYLDGIRLEYHNHIVPEEFDTAYSILVEPV